MLSISEIHLSLSLKGWPKKVGIKSCGEYIDPIILNDYGIALFNFEYVSVILFGWCRVPSRAVADETGQFSNQDAKREQTIH